MRCAVLLSIASVVVRMRAASAEPATLRLDYAGERCQVSDLRDRVGALLGRDPFVLDGDLVARARVAEQGARLVGDVAIVHRGTIRGQRVLDADTCNALFGAMAVVIALVLEEPPRAADPPPAVPVSPPPTTPAPARAHRSFAASAGGAASQDLGVAALVGARMSWERASLAVELELHAPESTAVSPGEIRIQRAGVVVVPCVRRGDGSACALVGAAILRGTGQELSVNETSTSPLFALGGRLAYERGLWRGVGVRAHVDLRLAVTTTRFAVDGMTAWTSPRGEAWLGISVFAKIF